MGRRAVLMSFELWKEILTQGWKAEYIECTKGLPDDAEIIGTYNRQKLQQRAGLIIPRQDLVILFESQEWNNADKGYRERLPNGDEVLILDVEWSTEHDHKCKTLTYEDRGERRRVRVRGVGHASFSMDFQAKNAIVNISPFDEGELQYEVAELA